MQASGSGSNDDNTMATRAAWTRLAWATFRLELGCFASSSFTHVWDGQKRQQRALHTLLCLAEGRYIPPPKERKGKGACPAVVVCY